MIVDFPMITHGELEKLYPWTSKLNPHEMKASFRGHSYGLFYKDKLALTLITLMNFDQAPLYVTHPEYATIASLVLSGELSIESRHFKALMNILNPYGLKNKTLRLLIRLHEEYAGYRKSPRFNKEVKSIFDKIYEKGDEDTLDVHIAVMNEIKKEIDADRYKREEKQRIIEEARREAELEKEKLKKEAREKFKAEKGKIVSVYLPVFLEYRKTFKSRKLKDFNIYLSQTISAHGIGGSISSELWPELLNTGDITP